MTWCSSCQRAINGSCLGESSLSTTCCRRATPRGGIPGIHFGQTVAGISLLGPPYSELHDDLEVPESIARAIRSVNGGALAIETGEYTLRPMALNTNRWITDESARLLDEFLDSKGRKSRPDPDSNELDVIPQRGRPHPVRTFDPGSWTLRPGETVERKALHTRYGGRKQGGIGPSKSSSNVLLFSDPVAGEPHGYFDGWRADGFFHYTGEGQRGDQQMKSGNAAILNHEAEHRALRLFIGARGEVMYEGKFELASDAPFYTTDAPETNNGPPRSVIVFRLQPLDSSPKPSDSKLDLATRERVEDVAIEQQWTEKAFVSPSQTEYEAERREQKLVLAYRDHLIAQGHTVSRLKIVPEGEAKPLFSDLIDRTTNTLIEAKGSVERGAIRMAIGQLMDYRRFTDPAPQLAVLLPSQPRQDLKALLADLGVALVWQDGNTFKNA